MLRWWKVKQDSLHVSYTCTEGCLVLNRCLFCCRGEDNALLVWSEDRGLNNPQVFPFPKLTQGSGYLLPVLTQSVSLTSFLTVVLNSPCPLSLLYSSSPLQISICSTANSVSPNRAMRCVQLELSMTPCVSGESKTGSQSPRPSLNSSRLSSGSQARETQRLHCWWWDCWEVTWLWWRSWGRGST